MVITREVNAPDDPSMAEALGVKTTLDMIKENGWSNIIIESDAKVLVDSIKS